ncbi:MAG: DNA-directed RNA polymerase subunit beta', partial [Tenericutes bacterium]|nr:DNA-directed RNA polymerase subunit beta' [Mycoplasmatota bacterium]
AFSDVVTSKNNAQIIEDSNKEVAKINKQYQRGLITDKERFDLVISVWDESKKQIQKELQGYADTLVDNPIFIMMNSKARGSISNFTQLAGMRGIMQKPNGEPVEIPIKSSFRDGLSVSEFFLSTHGARKGSADTALKTADSGYMTRRLVDVSQDLIIREEDCGTIQGVTVREFTDEKNGVIEPLYDRIVGRYTNKKVINPETKDVIIDKNSLITESIADKIVKAGIKEVEIRTVLTCKTDHGVCRHCYGVNLATGSMVEIGEAVGIMAAQAIGEPGTQLTMRTFHTGGVAGADITQGLPRVEELFEARSPKGKSTIAEVDGKITKIEDVQGKWKITIHNDNEDREHITAYGAKLRVEKGDVVSAGDRLTEGNISPKELLAVTDPITVQEYILKEVQKVYRSQGVEPNDKHIELIAKRMISKIKIMEQGDTDLLPGTMVSILEFTKGNKDVIIEGKKPAIGKPILLGITKASLETDSFLSAASFQETTRVLTEASVKGKVDKLHGLKENVIIGKLIPAGTGAKEYLDVDYSLEKEYLDDEASEVLEDEYID